MPNFQEQLSQARHRGERSGLEQLEHHASLLDSTHGPWHNSAHVNLKSFIIAAATAKLRRMRGLVGVDLRIQAEDVAEAVCAELYLAPPSEESELVAWVFRTITHEIEPSRSQVRGVHTESLDLLKAHGHGLVDPSIHSDEDQPELDEAAERLHEVLHLAVGEMSDAVGAVAVIKLFDAPDASYPEIAQQLHITVEAARQRWSRARKRLQLALMNVDLYPLVHSRRVARAE